MFPSKTVDVDLFFAYNDDAHPNALRLDSVIIGFVSQDLCSKRLIYLQDGMRLLGYGLLVADLIQRKAKTQLYIWKTLVRLFPSLLRELRKPNEKSFKCGAASLLSLDRLRSLEK
jgi:hypothetical protein